MNALAVAQQRWDNACPVDTSSHDEAADNWCQDAAKRLMDGLDVVIRRHWRAPIVIAYCDYLQKVQAYLNQRQIDGLDHEDWFAQLVIAANSGASGKTMAEALLGDPDELLTIALGMVEAHANAGLEAAAEDAEL